MRDKRDRKNKQELFNDRAKLRKEKQAERAQKLEEAGRPGPAVKKDDNAQTPPAPSSPLPVKPEQPAAPPPTQVVREKPNRPGKAERERRGPTRNDGRRF